MSLDRCALMGFAVSQRVPDLVAAVRVPRTHRRPDASLLEPAGVRGAYVRQHGTALRVPQ